MADPTFVAVGTSVGAFPLATPTAVPLPAGIAAGDLLLAFAAPYVGSGTGLFDTPAGWTALGVIQAGSNTGNTGMQVFWRFATGSEPASYNFTLQGSNNNGAACIAAWRNVNSGGPVAPSFRGTNETSATFTIPGVVTPVSACVQVSIGFDFNGNDRTFTAGGSATMRFNNLAKTGCHFGVQDELIPTATTTSGKTMVANTGGNYWSAAFALPPVGASGPTITTQPSNPSVTAPATASFSVAATTSGGSLSYQWQRSTNGGGSWASVSGGSGGTTANYTTPATAVSGGSANNGDQYRCAVTDSNGTTNSSAATLTVAAAPAALTTAAFSRNNGSAPGAVALAYVLVVNAAGTVVLNKTGLSLNSSSVLTFSDAALTTGTTYRLFWKETVSGASGWVDATAA